MSAVDRAVATYGPVGRLFVWYVQWGYVHWPKMVWAIIASWVALKIVRVASKTVGVGEPDPRQRAAAQLRLLVLRLCLWVFNVMTVVALLWFGVLHDQMSWAVQ